MTWDNRPYAHGHDSSGHGGLRSWMGGLPPPPRAITRIMIANMVVWFLCLVTGGADSPVFRWLLMRTDLVLHGQFWRILTFTYVHDVGGIGHIFFNMLGLYFLGACLERELGSRRFFAFYTIGGLAAGAIYFLVTTVRWLSPALPLVGASGNVLAVLGACAVRYPGIRLVFFFFPVPIRAAVVFFTVLYGFNLLTRGANAGGDACHLAGMAFGVAWGYRSIDWMAGWERWRQRRRRRAADARQRRVESLQSQVDRILAKVHDHGIQSLTQQEKDLLAEATRRQRGAGESL